MPPTEAFAQIQELLKQGKVQEAADVAAYENAKQSTAASVAPAKPAEPPPPRAPALILLEFMQTVADRFGNHAILEKLVHEFAAATTTSKAS